MFQQPSKELLRDNFKFNFKSEIPFGKSKISLHAISERRLLESQKIMEKYPDRIPVIIEKSLLEKNLPE